MSAHRILTIFAGGLADDWIASDFAGFSKFFMAEPTNIVTALTVVDLETFVKNGEVLKFGKEHRRTVFTQEEADQHKFYQVVPQANFKHIIIDWLSEAGRISVANDSVTLVFAGHGYPNGDWQLGFMPEFITSLSIREVANILRTYRTGVFVKILNAACFSGTWCTIPQAAAMEPIMVHASAQRTQPAWSLRSVSGHQRCETFAAAVIESLVDSYTLSDYDRKTYRRVIGRGGEISHPVLVVRPGETWTKSATQVLNVVQAARAWPLSLIERAHQAVGNIYYGPARINPPGFDIVRQALSATAFTTSDCSIVSVAEKYIAGTADRLWIQVLQDVINHRRQIQFEVLLFLKAAAWRGILSLSALHCKIDYMSLPIPIANNTNQLLVLFPELTRRCFFYSKESIIRTEFYLPIHYLSWFIAVSRSANPSLANPKEIRRIGEELGWASNKNAYIEFHQTVTTKGISRPLGCFDPILPVNMHEWDKLMNVLLSPRLFVQL